MSLRAFIVSSFGAYAIASSALAAQGSDAFLGQGQPTSAVDAKGAMPEFTLDRVRTTWMQRLPAMKKLFKLYFPLYPAAFRSFGPVALMKVSKSGGSPIEIDQGAAGWIRHLAVDAKQIYFTDIAKVYAIAK